MKKIVKFIVTATVIILAIGLIILFNGKKTYAKEIINPILQEGLIPVSYEEGNIIIANKRKWYNYENNEWANAVTVKNEYGNYRDSKPGTIIPVEAINTMWVWIPRFSYYINYNLDGTGSQLPIIPVSKENVTISVKLVNSNIKDEGNGLSGNYKTHEAFTFGNKELSGIWVGKFETSTDSMEYLNFQNHDTAQDIEPVILPNQTSLRFQNLSTQFETSRKISNTVNYGIKDKYDSHMMKNSEWEAMIIFTKSKYGINGHSEIYPNMSTKYITGRSFVNGEEYTYDDFLCKDGKVISNDYSKSRNGYKASTTGNITGIYDTVGGAYEYVMSKLKDYSGDSKEYNSGYKGLVSKGQDTIDGKEWPEEKYYDIYNNGYRGLMIDWNEGYMLSSNLEFPFIIRSSVFKNENNKYGISSYFCGCGDYDESVSFRTVLTEK